MLGHTSTICTVTAGPHANRVYNLEILPGQRRGAGMGAIAQLAVVRFWMGLIQWLYSFSFQYHTIILCSMHSVVNLTRYLWMIKKVYVWFDFIINNLMGRAVGVMEGSKLSFGPLHAWKFAVFISLFSFHASNHLTKSIVIEVPTNDSIFASIRPTSLI